MFQENNGIRASERDIVIRPRQAWSDVTDTRDEHLEVSVTVDNVECRTKPSITLSALPSRQSTESNTSTENCRICLQGIQ